MCAPLLRRIARPGSQPVEKDLHGLAHGVEAVGAGEPAPVRLELGNPVPRVVERSPAATGREDQLRPPVLRVGAAFQLAELLQLADQLRGGGQAQLRPGGQLGEPDAVDTDVAEDVQVRRPQVGVAVLGGGSGQLAGTGWWRCQQLVCTNSK